jgi:hypothetical protein
LAALEQKLAAGSLLVPPAGGPGDSLSALSGGSNTIRALPMEESVPSREPLSMEAAAPVYLRPRDALAMVHRLVSTASTTP